MTIRFLTLIGLIILSSCAKQSSPMGGPKDEDPPKLLSSDPTNEATNVKPSEVNLVFDEFIKAENPSNQIIITPRLNKQEIVFTALKTRLNIKLNQSLEENTTYVFNFQNSVQDITESNPAKRLRLVFSTGDEIDSLKFSGSIAYAFGDGEFKNVLVGLYAKSDTTDLFTAAPYYIGQADSAGGFEITNIKAGEYRAYAWNDDNNSNKAEYRSEQYGFLTEAVALDSNVDSVEFTLFNADISELKVNRSSPVAGNYDVILSKFPVELEVIHPNKNEKLFYRLKDKTIRFYHPELPGDSTLVQLIAKDSVGFSIDTSLYAKFEPSERSLEKLEISANSGISFVNNIESKITLNKPLKTIRYDSLYISYDTVGKIPIQPKHLSLPDSSDRTKILITVPIPDSITNNTFTVFAGDSTFIDIENQWNPSQLEANYNKLKAETLSEELSGIVEIDQLPILVQLLNKSDELVKEVYLTTSNAFKFTNIEAGQYRLRAIIDQNKNKRWDPGNIKERRQPEPVYYFYDEEKQTDEILLRGGWTNNGIVIKKRDKDSKKEDPK